MSNFSKVRKVGAIALIVATSAVLFSCTWFGQFVPIPDVILAGKPPVSFADGAIIVPRVLKITAQDLKDLNQILSTHNKSLYKVKFYSARKRIGPIGTLSCIGNNSIEEVEKFLTPASTNVAVQFTPKKPKPSGGKTCSAPNNLEPQAQDLREKLTPILSKYSKGRPGL